jgi:hypothetical protein
MIRSGEPRLGAESAGLAQHPLSLGYIFCNSDGMGPERDDEMGTKGCI